MKNKITKIKSVEESMKPSLVPAHLNNTDGMTKTELQKVVKDFILPLSDPTKYKEMIKASMPELVRDIDNRETAGQAMMQSGQEFLLAVVETLKKFHDFSDPEISKFLKSLQGNLTVVEKIEEGGLSMLSDHSMGRVVQMVKEMGIDKILKDIAEIRYRKESTWKSGLEYPNVLENSKIARKLQKPGK